ncbi:MAG TPA: lysophospholipid acyltransferase family protein [Cytophagales bacterium]|nr:lysophospholipid acyltransferase family protein [Cytophagales bacterium]
MASLVYYLTLPFIYLLAWLPFPILYAFSDVACFILRDVFKYRKDVVMTNLRNSFPNKSDAEIKKIYKEFFSYLCDLILETIKTLTMTEKEARARSVFQSPAWLDAYHEAHKSIIIVMGHYGNWEWGGPGFTLNSKYQLVVIYRPLSNPYFERMMTRMRTKFGTKISPVNSTLRDMVNNRSQITATAFIADQAASPETAYWTTFLHQETAVFVGPEKIAKKFNYPVVYMNVRRVKRGYYEVTPELMFDAPKDTAENEILEAFTRRLELEIQKDPVVWLWSHKRWKHKRKEAS